MSTQAIAGGDVSDHEREKHNRRCDVHDVDHEAAKLVIIG
jgi:hypothetical protein